MFILMILLKFFGVLMIIGFCLTVFTELIDAIDR